MVHDYIDVSIYERMKDSTQYFIVISVLLRICMIKENDKLNESVQMQNTENYNSNEN